MTLTLTAQQSAGIDKIRAWYRVARHPGMCVSVFRWFGYAGTGKTFTAARIPEALGLSNVVFGTYTGKAAHVLRASLARYGANYPVTTIHSAIYLPTADREARARLQEARDEMAELETLSAKLYATGRNEREAVTIEAGWASHLELEGALDEIRERIPELEAAARRLAFELNPMSEWAAADLIILDEVSMVNAKLAADIESFGVPVLVLGDPAQLPPVDGGGYYTEAAPDHLLTDVQRQALDNPVLALATRVRESTDGALGLTQADMRPASLREAAAFDQVLCWTNARRWTLVKALRGMNGWPQGQLVPGDRIMCLANNRDLGVFNGQQFTVVSTATDPGRHNRWRLTVHTDDGHERTISALGDGFQGRETQDWAKATRLGGKGEAMLATYAQAITVHKAQGSEWGRVYVANELPAMLSSTGRREGRTAALEQARRWAYTAATRAREDLIITLPKAGWGR